MKDWFNSMVSSSRPNSKFTAVGEEEVDEGGGEEKRLIKEGSELDGEGTGTGDGDCREGSWDNSIYQLYSSHRHEEIDSGKGGIDDVWGK
jgi:hypothetical protein